MAEQPGEYTDVESLLKTSANRMAEQIRPKLETGGQVRSMLEDRAYSFQDRAKQFILGELNTTASSLMRAIDAEEAGIIMDFTNAVDASFPPVPVLLAGLFSPTILVLSKTSHILQFFLLFGPICLSSSFAIYTDVGAVCSIPTMISWQYVAFLLSTILMLGHLMMLMKISAGEKLLKAKTEEIAARIAHNAADGETDLSDMQEIFIGSSVLVQQALLIEDSIRRSPWNAAIGMGTLLWLISTIWNAVIVIVWTFVPGTIAFHEKAHMIDGEVNPHYCGAWASVFTARVVCIITPMFFFVNVLQVVDWITKMMINSPSFSKTILGVAQKADAGMLGLPVVEYIVKAFVLRGSTDTLQSRLTVALSEKVRLQRERDEIAAELEAVENKIKIGHKEVKSLKRKAETLGGTGLDAMITQVKHIDKLDEEAWKEQGKLHVQKAMAESNAMKTAATAELDKMATWIQEIVEQIQNSETVQGALAQAREAADQAQHMAEEAADAAQHAAEDALHAAQDMAQDIYEQLPDEEAVQEAMAQAQEAAKQGAAKAQEVAIEGAAQAKEVAKKAQEQAEPLLAQAKEQAEPLLAQAKEEAEKAAKKATKEAKKRMK